MKPTRRTILLGGAAAVVVVVAGGATAAKLLLFNARTPEAEAAAYAKLLADVRDDYINGRVVEHDGWILSQHEFDTIGTRVHDQDNKPVAS